MDNSNFEKIAKKLGKSAGLMNDLLQPNGLPEKLKNTIKCFPKKNIGKLLREYYEIIQDKKNREIYSKLQMLIDEIKEPPDILPSSYHLIFDENFGTKGNFYFNSIL